MGISAHIALEITSMANLTISGIIVYPRIIVKNMINTAC